jgi:phosphonate transport system permease protein
MRSLASPERRAAGSSLGWSARFWLLVLAAFLGWSLLEAEVHPGALFSSEAISGVARLVRGLLPPDLSPSFLVVVAGAMARTVAIAVAGTALAVVLAIPLGLLATPALFRRGAPGGAVGAPAAAALVLAHLGARGLLRLFRSVPDLLWALLFVVAVGLGPLAGTLAVGVSYGGVLGRVYADLLEEVDPGPAEALAAAGAGRAAIVLFALVPQALPGLLGYTLYSLECAIRAASVLGFVGAGGIGQELQLSMRLFEYGQVSTLLVALFLLMAVGESASRRLRRALGKQETGGRRPSPSRRAVAWVAGAAALLLAAWGAGFFEPSDEGMLRRMANFAASLFPPDLSPPFLASLAVPLRQTLAVAGAGTLLGLLVGALLAVPASTTVMLRAGNAPGRRGPGDWLRAGAYLGARGVLAVLRGIPELLWVLFCIVAVGFGPFAGALALGLHTAGVLGKLWAEGLDEVPPGPGEVLEAAGASGLSRATWAAWPQARGLVASYAVLRWEFNLRVSALVGFLGGGGLGLLLYNALQLGFHERVCTLVGVIFVLVSLSDAISDRIRRSHLSSLRRRMSRQLDTGSTRWTPRPGLEIAR